jgi:tetratricopeptide (TPR) repeat protein
VEKSLFDVLPDIRPLTCGRILFGMRAKLANMIDFKDAVIARVLFVLCFTNVTTFAQVTPGSDAERYGDLGSRALAAGQYAEAEQDYEKLKNLQPGVAEVHATLGLIYFQEGKFDRAVPELRQALKLKPTLPRVDSLLAMSRAELGDYNEALPGLEKCFHQSADPVIKRSCGLQLTRTYTDLSRDSKAVETALELNRLYPDDPEVLYNTGKIYGNSAFLTMQKLGQVAPNSLWRHLAAAEADEAQGATDAAVGEYREVLKIDPSHPNIHFRIGRTLLARAEGKVAGSDLAEATAEFEQELQLDPRNANSAYELAEIHRKAGQLDEAQRYFEMAVASYPDFEEAHVGLAATLMAQQKPDLALPHLEKAVELNPDDSVAWYRLAQVERSLGREAEQRKAITEFQRIRSQGVTRGPSNAGVTQQKLDPSANP